jgi:hypothetical protein
LYVFVHFWLDLSSHSAGDDVEKAESAKSAVALDYSHVQPPTVLNIQDDPEAVASEVNASDYTSCVMS